MRLYANAHAGADTITFSTNVANGGGVAMELGEFVITSELTIDAPAGGIMIDNFVQANDRRFFLISGGQVTLNNLRMSNGRFDGNGGAISASSAIVLNRCVISSSNVTGLGGAIYSTAGVTLNECELFNNSASEGSGLCIASGSINRSTIHDNIIPAEKGGGLYVNGGGVTVTNSTISNNNAAEGGGIYNVAVTSTSPVVGGTITPAASVTLDVNFNEPYDAASVATTDLELSGVSGASVTGYSVIDADTIRFTISGLASASGTLNAKITAGALTDAYGNPNAEFTGSYSLNDTPDVSLNAVTDINEASKATLTGSYTDNDTTQSHTLTVGWDDPNNAADSVFTMPDLPVVGQTFASADGAQLILTGSNIATGQIDFSVQHTYGDNGDRTISLTVSDGIATSTAATTPVSIDNVAPVAAAIVGPGNLARNVTGTFTFGADDVSSIDDAAKFKYVISWGDGAVQTINGGSPSISRTHAYANIGVYTISYTATDKDTGVSTAVTRVVTVGGTHATTDPSDPTKTALIVGGTSGNDTILVEQGGGGSLKITRNGTNFGSFTFTGALFILGQDGNDTITVQPQVNRDVFIYGGIGADTITVGNGRAVAGQLQGREGVTPVQRRVKRRKTARGSGAIGFQALTRDDTKHIPN